jgi:excisionase family DNA binding protein
MTDELLTTEETVSYLKISKRTLFRMIHDGKIRGLKVGNTYRFKQIELDEDLGIKAKKLYNLSDKIPSQEENMKKTLELFMNQGKKP